MRDFKLGGKPPHTKWGDALVSTICTGWYIISSTHQSPPQRCNIHLLAKSSFTQCSYIKQNVDRPSVDRYHRKSECYVIATSISHVEGISLSSSSPATTLLSKTCGGTSTFTSRTSRCSCKSRSCLKHESSLSMSCY